MIRRYAALVDIVRPGGLRLLVRTRRLGDNWTLPGGLSEEADGGDPAVTAARELAEEFEYATMPSDLRYGRFGPGDRPEEAGLIFWYRLNIPNHAASALWPRDEAITAHRWETLATAAKMSMLPAMVDYIAMQRREQQLADMALAYAKLRGDQQPSPGLSGPGGPCGPGAT